MTEEVVAPLIEFRRDGLSAVIDVVDGEVVYSGDLPVAESAKLLFQTLVDIGCEHWVKSKIPPKEKSCSLDAERAIKFALSIDDHYDSREFLQGWLDGDTSEWPEFGEGADEERL